MPEVYQIDPPIVQIPAELWELYESNLPDLPQGDEEPQP